MNYTIKTNIMKKVNLLKAIPLFILTFFLAGNVAAQPKGKENKKAQHEKIEKMKIGFITNELDLSSKEAEKFWPIYNEMQKKIITEKKLQRDAAKDLKANFETYSDSDFKSKTTTIFNSESKEVEIKKESIVKIAGVIGYEYWGKDNDWGYKKATKLLSLEQRFKRELLNKINRAERPERSERPERPERPERRERPEWINE